ncbi:MAG TPA: carboxypeptidase regulatory-like domain-containing protein [Acidobacteriaceae bacterium]|nr:carboxypeptidase regulatory-like domain-containing protein [Acidobacteriaceae bacterium]
MSRSLCRAALLLCLLAAGRLAIGQTNTATITGTVTDPGGAAVPGAKVVASNEGTNVFTSATSDNTGRYTIPNLAPGFYDVRTSAHGFSTILREHQELLIGTTTTVDFPLKLSTVSTTVEVTTEVPVVDVTQNILSTVVQTKQLDNLPIINRSFASLAQLSPGVQVTPSSGTAVGSTLQFGDSGTFSNGYVVDGNSIEKFNNGGQEINLAQDWIQEFSVVTQQAPAEYGLSSAGFINAITRSGSNSLHARAYGYFQNAALNATPSFLPAKAPQKPDYSQQRLGGFLGGPIRKDHLFYFLGYERLNNLTSTPVNVPDAFASPATNAGVYPQTTIDTLAMAKIDYQINTAQSIHIRANEDYDTLGNNSIGASGSNVNTLGVGSSSRTAGEVFQVTWDDLLSPAVLNELRVDYYGNYTHISCNDASILGAYSGGGPNATAYGDPTGYYATLTYGGAGIVIGCTSLWGGQGERNWVFEDDTTVTRGAHELKFGLDAGRRNQYNRAVHRLADGTYTMPGTLTVPFDPATTSTYPLSYSVNWEPDNSLTNDSLSPFFGMFAQDSWKVNGSLTLNYGMRYDYDFTNSLVATLPSLNPINNDATNLAPRAGYAWTPFHNRRSVIRGGYGVYFDLEHGNVAGTYYTSDTGPTKVLNLSATSATLNPYCYGNTTCASGVPTSDQKAVEEVLAYALENYQLPNFAPAGGAVTMGGTTYTIPALASLPPTAVYNYVPNLKHPASMQATTGLAQEFTDKISASGDFVYTYGYNQYILYNANVNQATYQPINPSYTSISTYGNGGYFRLYSAQIRGNYRDSRGDAATVAYTFTSGTDDSPNSGLALVTTQTQATDPFNFTVDNGPAYVARNILNVSGAVRIPWQLQLSPIVTFNTALPYTATTTSRTVAGCPVFYTHCYPEGFSKNSLRGADSFTLNSRLSKTFQWERLSAMLMFEGYNLTNHVNYTSFQANSQATTFEHPIGAGPRRQLQAAFQVDF